MGKNLEKVVQTLLALFYAIPGAIPGRLSYKQVVEIIETKNSFNSTLDTGMSEHYRTIQKAVHQLEKQRSLQES